MVDGIDGIFAMRDGGEVEDWVKVGQRIVARVVAEGPFLAQRLFRINVSLQHDVGVGRHFQVAGLAPDEFGGFLAEVAGEHELVQAVGQRRRGAEGIDRVASKEHRHRHARAGLVVTPAVPCADLLQLPMHPGGALVIDLHPIHANVALARIGVLRHHAGQRDKAAAVQGPALLDGQVQQSGTGVAPVLVPRYLAGACALEDVGRFGPRLGARRTGPRTCG